MAFFRGNLSRFACLDRRFRFLDSREPSLFDVGMNQLLFGRGQLAALRHLIVLDHFPQHAAIGLARRDHRTAGTSCHHTCERAEVESSHLLLVTVTHDAVLFQNRHDLALEQGRSLGGRRDGDSAKRDDKTNPRWPKPFHK